MRQINNQPIFGVTKVTCCRCKDDLTDNACFNGFYSCPTCDAWISNVNKDFVPGVPGVINFNYTA